MKAKTSTFLVLSFWLVLIAVFVAFAWLMSPLGIGFNIDPSLTENKERAGNFLYTASYFLGIPALLIAQGVSIHIGVKGHHRKAYLISIGATVTFVLLASIAGAILT